MSARIASDIEMKDADAKSTISSSKHQDDGMPYVHKVGKPPKQDLLKEIKTGLKETFFSDDPFKPFKNQPRKKKLVLGLQALFPILKWGQEYSFYKFKGDFMAGCSIASLCIPQDIAYAKLAYLEPQYGLYSSFVPPIIYALMGSSRDIAIGAVAVVSLLLGTMVRSEFDPVKQKHEYMRLMFTATFFAGVTQAALGFFRLGFLIDFLSHAAIVGFMAGAAVSISFQQLKALLGIKKFTKKTDVISVMRSVIHSAHHGWNYQTILIGVSFLIFLLVAKYIGKKNKKLFWVPAIAPLLSIILATFFVFITHAERDGVQVINHIKKGINSPSAQEIYFSGPYVVKGLKIGAVAGLLGLMEAIAIGRTFAGLKGYQLDGNKEMVALGSMNIVGSLTSCYVATGSFSRSALNCMTGCHTMVSNIVMAIIVMLTLLFITPLFKYTPNAILGSIVISAVLGLIDIDAMVLLWKVDKFDFIACMGAFFGVVFGSVEIGLLVAVAISLGKILLQVTRPRTALLGKIPRTSVYRNVDQYPGAERVPGVLIIRVDSAIYFSNSNYIKERILRWLTDEEEQFKDEPRVEYLIVDMSPVTDIDTSGIHALEELLSSLQKKDIQLILSNPGQTVLDKLHASKFADHIGEDKIFLTVADAILTFAPKFEQA
uniref:sulfate transporter 1.3-like n=1 Tax=Erigeron canadensis TaxID=72917 RepID=UPI001CB8D04E|nr:sulfate transporter 1.3-like [Erigeron canadensis]